MLPINGDEANITARSATHVQITIDEHATAHKDVDIFIRYDKLQSIIGDAKGHRAYCRRQYWRKTNNCADKSTYADFVQLLTRIKYPITDASYSPAAAGCGFCDQLYASLDAGYVIKDPNGNEINIVRGSDNTSSDTCKLNRDVRKLEKFDL